MQAGIAHACHGHTIQLSTGLSVSDRWLVVTLLEVSEREECVAIGSLKTRSGMEPVPRCELSTYQPISR